jgi:hypothetical protein
MPLPISIRRQRRPAATWIRILFCLTICNSGKWALGQNGADCYGNMNTIALREALLSFTYTLCSGFYSIGTLDYNNELTGGQDMLPLRPNLHIKCGADGSRGNLCFINGGDVQVDGTNLFNVPGGTVSNVVLEGLTFSGSTKHVAWINKPGDILFKDCEFRVCNYGSESVCLSFHSLESIIRLRVSTLFDAHCLSFYHFTYRKTLKRTHQSWLITSTRTIAVKN